MNETSSAGDKDVSASSWPLKRPWTDSNCVQVLTYVMVPVCVRSVNRHTDGGGGWAAGFSTDLQNLQTLSLRSIFITWNHPPTCMLFLHGQEFMFIFLSSSKRNQKSAAMTFPANTVEMKTETQKGSEEKRRPYLQVSWWGRSLCPEGPPPRWRCSSCRASRGRNGLPHRWCWASPPGGWAQPSGRSRQLPAWLTCPAESQQTWSWPLWLAPQTCWRRVFVRVRGLLLPKFVFGSLKSGAWRFQSFPTLQMSSAISCSQLFRSPPCACWFGEKGAQITVP